MGYCGATPVRSEHRGAGRIEVNEPDACFNVELKQ